MNATRWSQVERLYHAALERPAAERVAFLRDACGDDGELRQEVESLLARASAANGFLNDPALDVDVDDGRAWRVNRAADRGVPRDVAARRRRNGRGLSCAQ